MAATPRAETPYEVPWNNTTRRLRHQTSQHGTANFASLAKLSLAQIYFSDGRDAQGEATLRDLIEHPTTLVSKDQATITLARYLILKRPADARKLLDPLKIVGGPVGQL